MIFPLFCLKNGAFRGNLAYFIKYAFLYTSIDIIKELPVIYNISITNYEKNGNFSFRIRRICVFSDFTWLPAEARGSRKAIETIVFSELLIACQHSCHNQLSKTPYAVIVLCDYRIHLANWSIAAFPCLMITGCFSIPDSISVPCQEKRMGASMYKK